MEDDILQEISNDKFEEIVGFLQKDVPESLIVINLLKSHDREDSTKETELKVFCPKGETSSEVIIVTLNYLNQSGYKFIKVYSSEDKASILQQALITTRRLDWTNVILEGLCYKLLPTLESVFQNKNIPCLDKVKYNCMFLPPETYGLFNHEVNVPGDFIIRPLTSEDASLIDKTWAYHEATTYDYVHHSIIFHGGLVLVHKYNGQLVSWAVGVWNTIGMVYTMPDYRHRGYAEVVIKALARKFITINVQPVCLIKLDNIPSSKLFKKLGFFEVGVFYCVNL